MPDKNKTHVIAVTGIIRNSQGKYLICKRSSNEKNYPNKWCVPGGKVERKDLNEETQNNKAKQNQWLDVFEKVLEREILEETGIKIKNIGYVSNIAFIRSDDHVAFVVSLHAEHADGEIKLDNNALVDYKWVTAEEAKSYDLIENIKEQIDKVDEKYKN